jgi:hypothetical protein
MMSFIGSARDGTAGPGRSHRIARGAFALLCVACAAGFFLFPTYPNYDSYYMLLWGREVLDGVRPHFEGFRVPTQHPLGIAVGAVLSLVGDDADRIWIALILASFMWLVWGIYRLGADAFTPLVGAFAAVLLLSRFDFGFLAARGYIDIPYMALVVWAAGMEQRRPRRGTAVFLLLAAAGLLRPEGWVLAGLYWLWMAWNADWSARARFAVLAAIGPVLWVLTDLVVTGNPLFSLTYTSGSAEDLGRQRTLSEIPSAVPQFLSSLLKLPVVLAAVAGLLAALLMTPRRSAVPFALLATGLGTFVMIGVAGLSVIERYLTVTALALLVFAAVGLGGWTMLARSRLRTAWMAAAIVLTVGGALYSAFNVNVSRFENELRFRGNAHDSLEAVLRTGETRAALRCGPLTFPNHKLVPDARWILDAPFEQVRARAEEGVGRTAGPEVYVTGRFAIFRHALSDPADPLTIQVPPDTHRRVRTSRYYALYVQPGC